MHALELARCSDRVTAAFIEGSAADFGYVPRGGDLDIQVVVSEDCTDCFEEMRIEGVPVEICCVSLHELDNTEQLLSHPSLPFYLMRGVVVLDPEAVLVRARGSMLNQLCDPHFVQKRFRFSMDAARSELTTAASSLSSSDPVFCAFHLCTAFWRLAATAPALVCKPPTTRRCGELLGRTLTSLQRADLASLAGNCLNPNGLATEQLMELTNRLASGDSRVSDAVEAMLDSGSVNWPVFPILRSALWSPMADTHQLGVVPGVLDDLGWGPASLTNRLNQLVELSTAINALSE